ncbi:uncharacterized protein EV154DRAFT_482228 [Mucor mucedo]|uniref:uncharacterized protein n=1 Tax=Mucor mucedo TaxID=29922 RepID=UPI00221F3C8C|nr:uncharacterized protein EV154DRAFT_482228 [Mucor mucedo]KAI7890385.1 hypothetical protein EV154DRAFT_482228 [Mucor mucedo]
MSYLIIYLLLAQEALVIPSFFVPRYHIDAYEVSNITPSFSYTPHLTNAIERQNKTKKSPALKAITEGILWPKRLQCQSNLANAGTGNGFIDSVMSFYEQWVSVADYEGWMQGPRNRVSVEIYLISQVVFEIGNRKPDDNHL